MNESNYESAKISRYHTIVYFIIIIILLIISIN